MKKSFILFAVLFFLTGLSSVEIFASQKKYSEYERFWVQYAENNKILFRIVSENKGFVCPVIKYDQSLIQTTLRIHDYIQEFPIIVCQASFENDYKNNHVISYKDQQIFLKKFIKKFSSLGDTGCIVQEDNLTKKAFEQNCLDPNSYGFSKVANNIAAQQNDVIVHVGDYFYSKHKCQDLKKCGGRPFGDNFATWRVDFLDNAEVMFKNAPMIFARGNHEKCDRGGKGWSVLFDNSVDFKSCQTYDDPFVIKFSNIDFLMIDNAYAEDFPVKSNEIHKKIDKVKLINESIDVYARQFDYLLSKIDKRKYNALITHRPMLSVEARDWKNPHNLPRPLNYVLQNALKKSSYKRKFQYVDFILSGHTHSAMLLDLSKNRHHIRQIVTGNGGAFLNTSNHLRAHDKYIDGYKVNNTYQNHDFGFALISLLGNKEVGVVFKKV